MAITFINSIVDAPKKQWDELWDCSYPFVQHDFLRILEETRCTNTNTGWQPFHCIAIEDGQLLAAMPLYLKTHSYGEYVFDWSWADAYANAGFDYYPKLLNAIPFTPATGPRIAAVDRHWQTKMMAAVIEHTKTRAISSFHCLFPDTHNAPTDTLQRLGCQFHWHNKNYSSFNDFLQELSSRKRKNINKERKKISEQGITIQRKTGDQITAENWQTFHQLYSHTYLKKSGHSGYLTKDFFTQIGLRFSSNTLIVSAEVNGATVAQAFYFYDDNNLYGRYWGATQEFDALHYECCYYQGIEFAIEKKLTKFDAGAQGEHKIARGFTPMLTQSFHSISHPEFSRAIAHFLTQENKHTIAYCNSARSYSPYKDSHTLPLIDGLICPPQQES